MSQIQLLDTATINRIAAGEVIERPFSVVKELVENSIDANSSAITVEINEGGISRIRVTDNGSGIENEQVKLAFLNHATSKIKTAEDIFNINSLGFRGEALASIASVSQLEIITKTHNSLIGKRLEIHGGEIKEDDDVGCPNGTTIIVKNLFFNTPARQKFLKKPSTEGGYICDILNRIALGHPNICFKFINNGKVALNTSGNNNLKNIVLSVYGKEFINKLLELDYNKYNFRVYGLIGKPELNRSNRAYENLFINGRYIKSDLVKNAVEDAYKTRIMVGKFPIYILNLELPSSEFDVNVHPTKLEVRFTKEYEIYDLVYNAVFETLQNKILIPKIETTEAPKPKIELKKEQVLEPFEIENPNLNYNKVQPQQEVQKAVLNEPQQSFIKTENDNIVQKALNDYKIIGQAFDTYIFIEQNKSIYIIDQHAAHEKILYEKFMNCYKNNKFNSQILLEPLTIKLNLKEKEILLHNLDLFNKIGFQIDQFGDSDYIIRAVPIIFDKPENTDFFIEILDLLNNSSSFSIDIKFDKIASISCKAAVKANKRLSKLEIDTLINDLMNLDNPFNCPHGRPTIIEMTKAEIEKKFKRIV